MMARDRQVRTLRASLIWLAVTVSTITLLISGLTVGVRLVTTNKVSESVRHLKEGVAAFGEGRMDGALESFEAAIRLNPANPVPHYWIIATMLQLGQYNKALQFAEEALDKFPDNGTLLDLQGDAYYKLGRFDEAAECYRRKINQYPLGYWEPWLKLAASYERMQEMGRARKTYEEVLRLNPNLDIALKRLSHLDQRQTESVGESESKSDGPE